jgi:hypothetical protein
MDQNQKKQQPENNDEQPYTFSDELTKKKIKRHLGDINDVITEKDIENVKIPGNEKPATVRTKKKEKKDKKSPVDDTPGNPVTPWDVLNE